MNDRLKQTKTDYYSAIAVVICFSLFLSAFVVHPDFPPLAHTGGFGEPTCRECHQGEALNAPGARLRIEGVPQPWRPGRAYRITVTLRKDSLARAGFELAARFVQGGASAGILIPYDSLLTAVDRDSVSGISYAHHTRRGTAIAAGPARWTVLWTAPLSGSGGIAFNVAALAANDDNSNLGDFVYTAAATTPAAHRR
ncbi:MAG: choice-of-anchor V domain-containing protein [Gemmatimonadales bacterium]